MRHAKNETSISVDTFWLLFGQFGATMTLEQLRSAFFPSASAKTMANKHSARSLPERTGDVYDTRDVAKWWDQLRLRTRP